MELVAEFMGTGVSSKSGWRACDTTAEMLVPCARAMHSTWPPAKEVPHRPTRVASTSAPRLVCIGTHAAMVSVQWYVT